MEPNRQEILRQHYQEMGKHRHPNKGTGSLTPEQRRERGLKATAQITPEQRKENGRKGAAIRWRKHREKESNAE